MGKKYLVLLFIIILLVCVVSLTFIYSKDVREVQIIKGSEDKTNGYAIYTEDGDVLYTENLEVSNSILNNVIVKCNDFTVKNPIGIVDNPPNKSITDIKDMVLKSLESNDSILIIYIDGLGYELYEESINLGYLPYISTLEKGAKALTVYPSITDVTFTSMVTGETPKYTGIHSRDKKKLEVDTIFDIASQQGKSSKIIEGNMRIVIDEVETVLNIDENKNDTIDDEIYETAMIELENPTDVLLVHFHSYDDFGHKYGPDSTQALKQLKVLDSYVENMVSKFSGKVIITSDHGMHNVGNGGEHGTFLSLDMFIPIIVKE
ncbi:alkaline phosphatase family protein [Proteiniborus sp.]|uniref:alkaline phosphatase family protein n=1 Tax=Proteiniborus sp. TaxID=2079015 RepID=UPI0033194635